MHIKKIAPAQTQKAFFCAIYSHLQELYQNYRKFHQCGLEKSTKMSLKVAKSMHTTADDLNFDHLELDQITPFPYDSSLKLPKTSNLDPLLKLKLMNNSKMQAVVAKIFFGKNTLFIY